MKTPTPQQFEDNCQDMNEMGGYYGPLSIAEINGKYYWSIMGPLNHCPEEITKELYDALLTFNTKEK